MNRTTVQNLAEVSDLLAQAVEVARNGEAFHPDFADDCLYFLGAVVELARLSGGADRERLGRAEAFLDAISRRLEDGEIAFRTEDLEALQCLQDLTRAGGPVAGALDREKGLYALVNPVHFQGSTLLCENDRGVYEDAWEALSDLAEAKRYARNSHIYLACLWPAAKLLSPEYREEAIASARQATYDRLIGLASEALDKLDIADEIVDPYEDGTRFCADLCESLRNLLMEHRNGREAEAVVLYAPDEGGVLIVNGQVIGNSDGPDSGDYIANPAQFFARLGRALGVHFSVREVEVNPDDLVGDDWSWDQVVAAWVSQRAAQKPAG